VQLLSWLVDVESNLYASSQIDLRASLGYLSGLSSCKSTRNPVPYFAQSYVSKRTTASLASPVTKQ